MRVQAHSDFRTVHKIAKARPVRGNFYSIDKPRHLLCDTFRNTHPPYKRQSGKHCSSLFTFSTY